MRHRVEPRRQLSEASAKLTSAGHPPTELLRFVDGVRSIYREAILGVKDRPEVSRVERTRAYRRALPRMAALLRIEWKNPDAARISKELRKRRGMLFTFLRTPGVPYHNNAAENAIRQGELIRPVSGGRRTWAGAHVLKWLLTVYRTCRKRGVSFRDRLLTRLMGAGPPLPSVRPQM